MNQRKKKLVFGQGLVEYVALTALVAIVCIGTVKAFGGKIRTRLNQITNTFDRNIQQGLKARSNSRSSQDDNDSLPLPGRNRGLPFPIPMPWPVDED